MLDTPAQYCIPYHLHYNQPMPEGEARSARQAAALLQRGFVVLDLETTSSTRDPEVAIVEIGLIDHAGRVLLDTRVNPGRPVTTAAAEVHGLEAAALAGAPDFTQVYPQLARHLNGRDALVYGDEAEQRVLRAVCARHALPLPQPAAWHDVARLYARYRRADQFLGLAAACAAEGLRVDEAHRALGDCRMTLALLRKIAAG